MSITCNMRRSRIGHHIFYTLQSSTLYIFSVIIKHLVSKMTPCKKFTYRKLRNFRIDKQPTFITTDIIETKRSQSPCSVSCTNPTGKTNNFFYIFIARIILCNLDSFRNKFCSLKKFRHDSLIFQ